MQPAGQRPPVAGTSTTRSLAPLPLVLPPVEERAAMPAGFRAGGLATGIKPSGRPDLAMIATLGTPAAAAAVFTTNLVVAAPIRLSMAHLSATEPGSGGRFGWASVVVSTSGCANAATGEAGEADQAEVCRMAAEAVETDPAQVLALSTGVIGVRLPLAKVRDGIARLALHLETTDAAMESAARCLMTTDTVVKLATASVDLPGKDGLPVRVTVSGMAKGVGMIHPRMATMLSVVLTDATAEPEVLFRVLAPIVQRTWNQASVDGDTSTNDTVFVLASGAAGTQRVEAGTPQAAALGAAIEAVARSLARQQAADGEGATTLITCQVTGAADDHDARAIARAVISSSLFKAAVHGRDPNWGRVAGAAGNARLPDEALLEAAGLSHVEAMPRAGRPPVLEVDRLRIAIAGTLVFDGTPIAFDREAVRAAMDAPEVLVRLDLGVGVGSGEAVGCDLTEGYVKENAEYTT
jgi:glutamate N-acetyltransferase / amino-acid N-acetyltransferase